MVINARIFKDGKFWVFHCPFLNASTQGRTKKELSEMVLDWLNEMIPDTNFEVAFQKSSALIGFDNAKAVFATALKRNRHRAGLSLVQMSELIEAKTTNAVRQYESGRHLPGIEKLQELYEAMGYELSIDLRERA